MNTSKLRQELSWFFKEIEELKGELITRKPMARGTVYELKRKCGKSNCRCMKKGELHKQMCIAITRGGKKTLLPIKAEELAKLEKLNKFHRSFRKARARFINLSRQIVKLSTQLEEEMLKVGDLVIEKKQKNRRR